MTHIKQFLIFILIVLSSVIIVGAHSIYLFNISLDFDKELKENTVNAAKNFLSTDNEPISFDLDKGLIIVLFEPEQRNYVEVNPLAYEIYGMRNENLRHSAGTKTLTEERGLEIAKKIFEKLPGNAKPELRLDPEVSEVDGTYFYKWFRYVNGILAVGEDFMVQVDAVNGSVIAWRLSIFDYPKDSIGTTPAITKNVAGLVAELSFNAPSVNGFEPYLVVNVNEPVWVNKLQGQFYPFFAGVSAKDGSISFTGTLPGDVPKNYHIGQDIDVIETELIKEIYNSK
ncbi:hypothetical protein HYW20_04425 [Candidatus Woesearchaeota archaeon]|nr:hypothetical protein [Candidatus Woesearchaeota archaeon]